MASTYHRSTPRRVVNMLVKPLARLGLAGRHTYILTVRGLRTGRTYATPVRLIENGDRWLVAPYGEVSWVRNARAAGEVQVQRGGRSETLRIEEVGPARAAPVLRVYLKQVPIVRPFFDATPDAPTATLEAEAPRHPVFRLVSAEGSP